MIDAMRVYIDTNILIDLVCNREDFLDKAQKIFALGYARKIRLVVSALSFVNAVYIARRYKIDAKEIIGILKKIASFVELADLSSDVIQWGLDSQWNDFEDATQYYSAQCASADYIVTRNKKDYTHSSIPVLSPDEFLSITGCY